MSKLTLPYHQLRPGAMARMKAWANPPDPKPGDPPQKPVPAPSWFDCLQAEEAEILAKNSGTPANTGDEAVRIEEDIAKLQAEEAALKSQSQ
jgi:hypothetical protein